MTVLRTRGLPFTVEQGRIRNLYTMQLENKDDHPHVYFVGTAADALSAYPDVEFLVPQPRVHLPAMGGTPLTCS